MALVRQRRDMCHEDDRMPYEPIRRFRRQDGTAGAYRRWMEPFVTLGPVHGLAERNSVSGRSRLLLGRPEGVLSTRETGWLATRYVTSGGAVLFHPLDTSPSHRLLSGFGVSESNQLPICFPAAAGLFTPLKYNTQRPPIVTSLCSS